MIQEEWSVISGRLGGVINGKLAERQQIVPIALTMIDEGRRPQSVFYNPINPFSKAIGLWMIGGAETKLSS